MFQAHLRLPRAIQRDRLVNRCPGGQRRRSFPSTRRTSQPTAILLEVKGAIGPASADYVLRGLAAAEDRGAALVVLRLDTPGGLDSSMRDIIQGILAADIPVVTYVTPRGARAASAGTYILYASHIAAMAPATTLGAATPSRSAARRILSRPAPTEKPPDQAADKAAEPAGSASDKKPDGDEPGAEKGTPVPIEDAMSAKAINDAAAYIRGLATMRGRNAEWAEQAVREAAEPVVGRRPGQERHRRHRRRYQRTPAPDRRPEGRIAGGSLTIQSQALRSSRSIPIGGPSFSASSPIPMWRLILMMIGIYGMIFEFMSPGVDASRRRRGDLPAAGALRVQGAAGELRRPRR